MSSFLIAMGSFLAVIIVLVMAHELGHFVTAKLSGIKVEEFGLFYPPRLLYIKRGDTIYSINALPLGGFVKMAGEEDPDIPGSLASKGYGTRLLVLASGSLMNFILPVLLFSIAFMVPHEVYIRGTIIVDQVSDNSPASMAGIVPGDTILEVGAQKMETISEVSSYFKEKNGQEISLLVEHSDGSIQAVSLTPRPDPPPGDGPVGVLLTYPFETDSLPFWEAVPEGLTSSIDAFVLFKNGIVDMIMGIQPVELAGPVGIAQAAGEVAQAGLSPLLAFAAFLSLNLAIINIFPLPALDGGRIAFVLLEWVRRGKKISPEKEGRVHLIGFALLLAFFLAVTFHDIMRIISGGSLLP